jgi:2-isopropylmalate synthase
MSKRKVMIFDTTLRDGEQAPGFSMNTDEKIKMALQLEKLGVDVMEAGFPISSPGDFDAVSKVAAVVKNSGVAGLCRANPKDIEVGWDALKGAVAPRIHTFIATSDIHLKYKLKKSREEVLEIAVNAVKLARKLCGDVEFSAEDATRSDLDFLCQITEAVIDAGATTVNLPDTVGYTVPMEYEHMISTIMNKVPNVDKARISVHCHNDLGLAVANSLVAVNAGATQVECTVNGIGERAGNCSIEEVIMGMQVRPDIFNDVEIGINSQEIYRTSKMLTSITGVEVQPNKAIVGKNAFAHEAGIHQDGMLKNRMTYEIMTPESVGYPKNSLVLGKHSGRHAFADRLNALGLEVSEEGLQKAFEDFKVLADKKKEVYDEDIEAIIFNQSSEDVQHYEIDSVTITSGNASIPTATIRMKDMDGNYKTDASIGDGPVDAAMKAVERIAEIPGRLKSYKINAITAGKDAQGEVNLTAEFEECGYDVRGRGSDTDVVISSVKAYVDALNKYIARKETMTSKRTSGGI